jgi:hypothetical protein
MAKDERSLWEVYDSEIEPWRRGRIVLVTIAFFQFLFPCLVLVTKATLGDIEYALGFGVGVVFLWILFYFIWVGIHWVRWLYGGWNALLGFVLLIWGWRDNNILAVVGCAQLVAGGYLCLSPSVYAFAKRQRETVSWKEWLVFAAICLLILTSLGAAMLGLFAYRVRLNHSASTFAGHAARRIYGEPDRSWIFSHLTRRSLSRNGGRARMEQFLVKTRELGSLRQITCSDGAARLRFHFPASFESEARVICRAETEGGPVLLYFILWNFGADWEIERVWWEYLPQPESAVPAPSR